VVSRTITLDGNNAWRYYLAVIISFRSTETEDLANGRRVKRFVRIESVARRKPRQWQIAGRLEDLRVPPGNRLEALKGDRAGQHSIRVNDQFRVCFRWTVAGAEDVEIVDYHEGSETMPKLKPVTPGELLREEFLKPMGMSQYRLAKEIGVPAQRIGEIVAGKRAITADTDLRLCRFFGLSNGYWLRAQAAYDTEVAEDALSDTLKKIKPWSGLGRRLGHTA
jgi:antitoxin HigA-1